jgi:hypothetical protein
LGAFLLVGVAEQLFVDELVTRIAAEKAVLAKNPAARLS